MQADGGQLGLQGEGKGWGATAAAQTVSWGPPKPQESPGHCCWSPMLMLPRCIQSRAARTRRSSRLAAHATMPAAPAFFVQAVVMGGALAAGDGVLMDGPRRYASLNS